MSELAELDEAREALERQQAAASRRYRDATSTRRTVEERQAEGTRFPDSAEHVAARAGRLIDRGGVPASALVDGVRAAALTEAGANERIINIANESQPWSFLPRGARAAATVARISVRTEGREQPHGTGFMVSPRLLMTNQHVLLDEAFSRRCFVEFNVQNTVDNTPDAAVRFALDPAAFFVMDKHLDFALVAVAPAADGRLPGEVFGWNRLSVQQGKVLLGERVNVIGHPGGRFKEVAFRDNTVQDRLPEFLHYTTDTERGNSGSPVFNDQWEVVALHHSGVAREDAQGNRLLKNGGIARPGDPDDAIDYIANEGARVSSILKHLATLQPEPEQRALLAEMGPESGLQQGPAAAAPASAPVPGPISAPIPAPIPAPSPLPAAGSGSPHEAAGPAGTAVIRSGLPARGTPAVGGRHLVFLHGRSQHEHEPEELRRGWTAGLNHGLTRAGLPTVDPADVWFPFYADRIVEAIRRREGDGSREAVPASGPFEELSGHSAAEAFAAESTTGMYEQLLLQAAAKAGMPQDGGTAGESIGSALAGRLRRAVSWLVATTDMDALAIATRFRDVDAYLDDRSVRDAVLTSVLDTLPPSGEIVLVTHSLGTVVGMDLVHRLPEGLEVSLLVSTGSPLGMDTVYSRLLPPGPNLSARVRRWINAWCPTDTVALGCPLGETWGKLTDMAVENANGRAHSIEEYLAHAEVAAEIGHGISRT
ncbi:trypsin-like serine peptidase [Streptomyces katrae]|uniref:trypsin-like serine peptidase n=1 Tax=Streptomyces katrae TaxID=68223 RepID=UPI0004C14881|nr:serine protease [Streptomyces katrae]